MPITFTVKERAPEYRKLILEACDFGGEDLANVGDITAETITTTGDATVGGDLAVTGEVGGAILDIAGNGAIGGDVAVEGEVGGATLDIAGAGAIGGELEVTGVLKGSGGLEVGGASGVDVILHEGVPDAAVLAKVNSLCIDTTNHDLYINTGTAETPVWLLFTRASGT